MSIIYTGYCTMIYENYFLLLQQENKVPSPRTEPITASIRGIIYFTHKKLLVVYDLR
jgi:hypothetical protein